MKVAARQENGNGGWVYGTLRTTRLSDTETIFSLFLDDRLFSGKWFAFDAPTLSGIVAEAEARGLSDLQPDIG